jgi:predicted dehydrogenase
MAIMKLRLAVVGLAHGASYIALAQAHPEVELVGLVDRDDKRLQAAASASRVPGFRSVEELLAAKLADAVVLALPTQFHASTSIACLAGGLHVLQEKPLCRSDAEAQAISAAVAHAGKVFQVGYEVRSSPFHRSIMEHVRRGDLGTLTNIWYNQHTLDKHAPNEWRASRANMGGKLFDCAVHYLDLMQQWAGAPVSRLVCLGNLQGVTGPQADDLPQVAAIAIEYANGVRGTFNFGAVNRLNDDSSFGLTGTTGRIQGNPWLPEGAGSYELRRDCGIRKSQVVFDGKLTSTGHLGFKEQFSAFVATVCHGAPNACPIADAVALHRQMVALDQSLATAQVITL